MAILCDPEGDAACTHWNRQEQRIARGRLATDKLFASSEMKIFGATVAIIVFAWASFHENANNVPVLKSAAKAWGIADFGPTAPLYLAFFAGVLFHHIRMFLGLSYSDNGTGEEARALRVVKNLNRYSRGLERGLRRLCKDVSLPLLPRRRSIRFFVTFERWLRTTCIVTYPMFSVYLFNSHVGTLFIIWFIQIGCMLLFDIVYLRSVVPGHSSILVWISDALAAAFALSFAVPGKLDSIVSKSAHIQPRNGELDGLFVLLAIILIVGISEFFCIYGARIVANATLIFRYLRGASIVAPNFAD